MSATTRFEVLSREAALRKNRHHEVSTFFAFARRAIPLKASLCPDPIAFRPAISRPASQRERAIQVDCFDHLFICPWFRPVIVPHPATAPHQEVLLRDGPPPD